jgi:hypothetical protein
MPFLDRPGGEEHQRDDDDEHEDDRAKRDGPKGGRSSGLVAMSGESPPANTEASFQPSEAPLHLARAEKSSKRKLVSGPYMAMSQHQRQSDANAS